MIKATVIADSLNQTGNRLTTLIVTMPRYILAEFNTHRMFSRNSASSRAIPFKKIIKSIQENPFVPMAWQIDHKGMQGTEYFDEETVKYGEFNEQWLSIRDNVIEGAIQLHEGIVGSTDIDSGDAPNKEFQLFVTKQMCNRLLEAYMYHTVIVSATEWENFFYLRAPQYETPFGAFRSRQNAREAEWDIKNSNPNVDISELPEYKDDLSWLKLNKGQADIHMMATAEAMWDAINSSKPKQLKAGEWHIPFGDKINLPPTIPIDEGYTLEEGVMIRKVKIATARCARVSYTVVGEEGKPDNYENDITLHDRLAKSGHWSPFEHCAKAMEPEPGDMPFSGNFQGFIQYRKMFKQENITQY